MSNAQPSSSANAGKSDKLKVMALSPPVVGTEGTLLSGFGSSSAQLVKLIPNEARTTAALEDFKNSLFSIGVMYTVQSVMLWQIVPDKFSL